MSVIDNTGIEQYNFINFPLGFIVTIEVIVTISIDRFDSIIGHSTNTTVLT